MSENRIICICHDIDYMTIKKAIDDGADTLDKIKEITNAGTMCEGCESEIEFILNNG